ncbi:MAG TPA: tail fiber protein, partial [Methylocystis sp.]|nr:tail fiber protein [Methylocystis sp.]
MKKFHILSAAVILFAFSTAALAGSVPIDNYQPSLAVMELLPSTGIFPTVGSGTGAASGDTLGFVYSFAGPYRPGGAEQANGTVLPINQFPAQYSIMGNTYGGNFPVNFALPNLQGRTIVGDGQGPGLSTQQLGVPSGAATITLGASNLPGGGAQPFNNREPSLPLTPLIAIAGADPAAGGAAFVGQVAYFAGNYVPTGWARADGSIVSVASDFALFSVIGNRYGGNGVTTFGLPNLLGRSAVGVGAGVNLAQVFGQETTQLQTNNLPGHGNAPVNNIGPSLGLHYIIAISGNFPAIGGSAAFNANIPTLGEISLFAGDFAPAGWAFADGQTLSIPQNPALFSVLGPTYGGNGITTFDLPNLDGRTIIGAGNGFNVGELIGSNTFTLKPDNLPILP